MAFRNVYEDAARAEAYSRLEFPGTYYLAYRDLPALITTHVSGRRALDFGCGAGRSTRFLRALGFAVLGVDVSEDMIARAREIDPAGEYRGLAGAALRELSGGPRDLVLSAFTFDNVPQPRKLGLLRELRALLSASGRVVNLVSAPEIYTHEWASFATGDFPANRRPDRRNRPDRDHGHRRPPACRGRAVHGRRLRPPVQGRRARDRLVPLAARARRRAVRVGERDADRALADRRARGGLTLRPARAERPGAATIGAGVAQWHSTT